MRYIKFLLFLVALPILLGLASGCGPGSVEDSGTGGGGGGFGTGSGITVTVNPASMSTSGVGVISADVRDTNGNPVPDGTLVTFTLGSPTLGTLSSATATTTGGIAQVTLTVNTITGSLLITAASGTDTGFAVVTISASPPTAMSVSSSATLVAPLASSTITAYVADGIGNPVANQLVNFSLSNSLLGSLTSGTAVTNVFGNAVVTFTANTTSAVVTVNATAGTLSGSADITISSGLVGGSIAVVANPSSLTYLASSTVTATLLDSGSNPVPGATVTFTLSDPTLGSLSSATATSDALGVATVNFTAAAITGSETITASSLTLTNSTIVAISAPTGNGSITLSAIPASMVTFGTSNISALLLDNTSTPITGVVMDFTLSNPTAGTLSSATATTDAFGLATITFDAGSLPTNIVLTASYAPLVLSSTTNLSITVPPPADVSVIPSPPAILVLGTSTITATVLDAPLPSGNPVPDGQVVTFSLSDATLGTLTSTTTTTANNNGTATTTFLASNNAGTVTITAVAGSVSATTTIAIAPAETGSIEFVSATPQAVGIKGTGQQETSNVQFLVKDINGNPAADGTAVTFSMVGPGGGEYIIGSIIGGTVATSSTINGAATVTLHSGTVAGPVTIIGSTYVNSNDLTTLSVDIGAIDASIPVASTAGFPSSGIIKIENEFIRYTSITGVSFEGCTRGEFGTTAVGHLASQQVFGQTTISTSSSQISIGGGVPSANHFNLSTSQWNLGGLSTCGLPVTITAYMSDRFGNYNIPQGTQVNYYAEEGASVNSSTPTDAVGTSTAVIHTCPGNIPDVKNVETTDGDFADFARYYGGNEPYDLSGTLNNNPRDGWVTFLATTMGEEAFIDENGDGLFTLSYSNTLACPPGYSCECDGGVPNAYAGTVTTNQTCVAAGFLGSRSEGFIDNGEPFYDNNDNAKRDDGSVVGYPYEQFIDADGSGSYDLPNGLWDGPECQTTGCLTSKIIWKNIRLILTYNIFYFWPVPDANNCYSTGGGCTATYDAPGFAVAPASIVKGGSGTFCTTIGDENLNRPPGGTVISGSAAPGTVAAPNAVTLIDTFSTGPYTFCFTVSISATEPAGFTTVSVTVGALAPVYLTVPLSTPPLTVATAALPTGTIGVVYNASLAASGGITPYVDWIVTLGALPAGLTINASGTISGTPTGPAGTANFTVRVTDSAANTATRALTLTIN